MSIPFNWTQLLYSKSKGKVLGTTADSNGEFNFQNEQDDKSIQLHQQGASGTIKNIINGNTKTTLSDTEYFVDVDLKIKDNLSSDTSLNLNAPTTTINNFIEVGSDTLKFLTNTGTYQIRYREPRKESMTPNV